MSTREDREADAAADATLPPEEDGPLIRLVKVAEWVAPPDSYWPGRVYPAAERVEVGYRNDGVEEWGVLELTVAELRALLIDAQSILDGRGPVVYR